MFWQNKKKFDFSECLSILDILRKWLLRPSNFRMLVSLSMKSMGTMQMIHLSFILLVVNPFANNRLLNKKCPDLTYAYK